ncbi:transferase [Streptomyces tubbatahanensis]|uniref:Transferase n=1 Tax=Streptomyces tubbatahanensis TaxID=2923272 RepID=A0ABY3XRL7_9ACTN|nr:transferase [Streptomyces tubbatahanensis]UNS97082.1 transferase [Streptomyces tubbatahanensis]
MSRLRIGDYVTTPSSGLLADTPYAGLEETDLADFLAGWEEWHRLALEVLPHRIHPTAEIHRTALIGDDVIIGPGVRVWEFSTVRAGSVLGAGVTVGFNCEVTRAFVGDGTVLGHRIGLNRTIVGSGAHLSANVTAAAISLWSTHLSRPEREIRFRVPGGIYRCGTPRFGVLLGDGVQTGNNISLGPGLAVGRGCRIASGVTLAGRTLPDRSIVTAPHTAETHVRRGR